MFTGEKFDRDLLYMNPTSNHTHGRVIAGYDGSRTVDSMVLAQLVKKGRLRLKELIKQYTEEEWRQVTQGTWDVETVGFDLYRNRVNIFAEPTTIKETAPMGSATKYRTPNQTIDRADLDMALRAVDYPDIDFLLDKVAIIQTMDEGEVLQTACNLKSEDIGRYITVVNGDSRGAKGRMSDINRYEMEEMRISPQLVLDGKMVKLSRQDFVIVSEGGADSVLDMEVNLDL